MITECPVEVHKPYDGLVGRPVGTAAVAVPPPESTMPSRMAMHIIDRSDNSIKLMILGYHILKQIMDGHSRMVDGPEIQVVTCSDCGRECDSQYCPDCGLEVYGGLSHASMSHPGGEIGYDFLFTRKEQKVGGYSVSYYEVVPQTKTEITKDDVPKAKEMRANILTWAMWEEAKMRQEYESQLPK